MATAPLPASEAAIPADAAPYLLKETVREGAGESAPEREVIQVLRRAALIGTQPLESLLDAIAKASQVLTRADGIALALRTNGKIVCRARSGHIAPGLGAPMDADSGISGECLRTKTMLVCHDSLSDPRVDREVCLALDIRSVVAVPVQGALGLAGILEAFASRPNAFDGDALSSLRELAQIAETAFNKAEHAAGAITNASVPIAAAIRPSNPPPATVGILESLPAASNTRVWMAGGIALVLLAAVAVAWWSWRSPADEASGGIQAVQAATASDTRIAVPHLEVPKPAAGVSARRAEHPEAEIVVKPPADSTSGEKISGSITDAASSIPHRVAGEDVVEPPVVTVVTNGGSEEELSRLASVSPRLPAVAPRVSEGVVEPTLIHKVQPNYPLQAWRQHLKGKVTVHATIGENGIIRQVAAVRGLPILAEAATAAVKQWRYRPATLNGTPVEVQKEITFVFDQPQ